MAKSSIFFSPSVKAEVKTEILEVLGAKESDGVGTYLGIPTIVGKKKKELFQPVKEKIWKRVQGWKEKYLSTAGRELLIKSVAMAIPTYFMSVFKLPVRLCHEINMMLGRYWWGDTGNGRGIHWISWANLCKIKREGGLGFKDLELFNQAMLAKQACRLYKRPDSLLGKVLKARYYPKNDVLEAKLGVNPSFTWGSIWSSIPLLEKGLIWRIGNGESVKVWKDRWVPKPIQLKICSPPNPTSSESTVKSLLGTDLQWNEQVIDEVFWEDEAALIKKIPISPNQGEDTRIWHYDKSGEYSVRSGYNLAVAWNHISKNDASTSDGEDHGLWKCIWKARVPNKIKIFMWKACLEILPVKVNLLNKKVCTDPYCVLCGEEFESSIHCLRKCTMAEYIWKSWGQNKRAFDVDFDFSNMREWLQNSIQVLNKDEFDEMCFLMWKIWNARNKMVFEGIEMNEESVLESAWKERVEFNGVNQSSEISEKKKKIKWSTPSEGTFKINFDAATYGEKKGGGIGIVIRDWKGEVVAAKTTMVKQDFDARIMEALAAVQAAKFADELGLPNMQLEGDNLEVIKLLNGDATEFSPIAHMIRDVHLAIGNKIVSFEHICREGNVVAHKLARNAINFQSESVWFGEYPDVICSSLLADLINE